MTLDSMAMKVFFEKGSKRALVREMVAFGTPRMMDVEVESLTGAVHGEWLGTT